MKVDSMDNVSIIIRNRNEAEFIGFAIQSCLDYFNKPEIIIIDNESTDDSLEVVNLFRDRTHIRVKYIKEYTPGKALNLGVKYASRDYILILSAHSQITDINLEIVKTQLDAGYVSVFGQQNPIYRGKKISKRYIWSHFVDNEVINMFSEIEKRQFLHNAFAFYTRSFLINNPMPEEYPGKEDRFWAIDVVEKGFSYLYNPSFKVNHFYTHRGATWKGIG